MFASQNDWIAPPSCQYPSKRYPNTRAPPSSMAGITCDPKSIRSSDSQRRRARFENTYTPIEARSLFGCLGFSFHSVTRSWSSMARMPIRVASTSGTRRTAIPLGAPPAADVRLEQLHAALGAVQVPRPSQPDVVVERPRVVLGQDNP